MGYEKYATTEDLCTYLDVQDASLPQDAERLLSRASELVAHSMFNNYDETKEAHNIATRLATCAQVEYWLNASELSSISDDVASYSLGSLSITNRTGAEKPKGLSARALRFLMQAGLLYRGI